MCKTVLTLVVVCHCDMLCLISQSNIIRPLHSVVTLLSLPKVIVVHFAHATPIALPHGVLLYLVAQPAAHITPCT